MPVRILRKLIPFSVIFLAACSGLNSAFLPVGGQAAAGSKASLGVPTQINPAISLISTRTLTPFLAFTNTPTRIIPTPAPSLTPAPLGIFSTRRLIPQASPITYLDRCSYLENRWDDYRSAPGTVVVTIMYHQVVAYTGAITDPNQVAAADFEAGLEHARKLGFESITAVQLADFLETNAYIPPRSVLLVIDDLETPAIKAQYDPLLTEFGFNATLAYITGQRSGTEWQQVEALLTSGRYDLQAHGYLHNGFTYIHQDTPEETLVQEIFTPVGVVEDHSGEEPVAFIWPGGDYTPHAVDLAADAGYRLGFTIRNRGPVMFNWIPQGSDEQAVRYPLLVLPRAWSKDVITSLDQAVSISEEAQLFAYYNREAEINWYSIYCKG